MNKKSIWPFQKASLITNSDEIKESVSEALTECGWELSSTSSDIEEVSDLINKNQTNFLIIDDFESSNPLLYLRRLISIPMIYSQPIICLFRPENQKHIKFCKTLLDLECILKPVTKDILIENIKKSIQTWSSEKHTLIRKALFTCNKSEFSDQIKILQKVIAIPKMQFLTFPILATTMKVNNEYVLAEKYLLKGIKSTPRNLTIMLLLGDLYLRIAMPKNSSKIFQSAYNIFGRNEMLLLDLFQSSIIKLKYEKGLSILESLYQNPSIRTTIKKLQISLLLALGREKEAQVIAEDKQLNLTENYFSSWEIIEDNNEDSEEEDKNLEKDDQSEKDNNSEKTPID